MASSAFKAAVAAMKVSKNIETVLVGTDFLGEGKHDVSIKTVDIAALEKGKVTVTYVTADGKEYRDNMFVMGQDGTEFSYGLRALWSALIPQKEALAQFIDLVSEDDKAFEMFTGMKLSLTLAPGKGIQARAQGDGTFAGYDVETLKAAKDGEVVPPTTPAYPSIKEVYDYCKGNDLQRSYLRITKSEATAKEENLVAFGKAVEAKAKAKTGVTGTQFSTAV